MQPKLNSKTISIPSLNGSDEPLQLQCNHNLISAWLAEVTGARQASANGTICSINVGPLYTNVSICRHGSILDTACLELGWDCLSFDESGRLLAVSDGAETFLDAVAKRLRVGDSVEQFMYDLIGELIAETIVNLVYRPRPPQVSQRLLCTEPFFKHHKFDELWLSGELCELLNSDAKVAAENGARQQNLAPSLAAGLKGSLDDRHITRRLLPAFDCVPAGYTSLEHYLALSTLVMDNKNGIDFESWRNLPVFMLKPTWDRTQTDESCRLSDRLAEFRQRHALSRHATVLVAASPEIQRDASEGTGTIWIQLGEDIVSHHSFLTLEEASQERALVRVKQLVFSFPTRRA
jgi:ethanolamine utilization protein EutA (predicted chaperonin)